MERRNQAMMIIFKYMTCVRHEEFRQGVSSGTHKFQSLQFPRARPMTFL